MNYGINPTDNLKNSTYSTKITYAVVADEPELVTMQDFNPDSLADGESTTLVDARDGNRYTVKKFGTGDAYPQSLNSLKYFGFAVRCVSKS